MKLLKNIRNRLRRMRLEYHQTFEFFWENNKPTAMFMIIIAPILLFEAFTNFTKLFE